MATTLRWPIALPQSLPLETSVTAQQNYVESEMDTGPTKRRRRFTAVTRYLELPDRWVMNRAQWEVLDFFYRETLGGGALSFMWLDPMPSLGDVECRFRGEPPKAVAIRGEPRVLYRVAAGFEVLP